MSEHCTCATSDYCQVHDEIDRLKRELAAARERLERASYVLLPLALSAIEPTGQYLATQDAIRAFLADTAKESAQ